MILALTTSQLRNRPAIWESVHRLRHEIFVEEMGWEDIRRDNGLEIDQFDHEDAIHHLAFRNGDLAGYQRMLPTERPYLLSTVLQDLCEGPFPCGRNVWELTRYAVAKPWREGRRGVSSVGSELIAGFIEWGQRAGVDEVIIEFEPMWVLRALQLGFLVRPLGYQRTYGRQQVVAAVLKFTPETLRTVRRYRGENSPVLQIAEADQTAFRLAS